MTKVAITEQYLTNIANAIRSKSGSSDTYTPAEMATAIANIPSGGGDAEDGNYIEYGITDTTLPLAGIAVVGLAVLVETSPQTGTAKVGYTVIGG